MTQIPGPTSGPTNAGPTHAGPTNAGPTNDGAASGLDRFFGWIRSIDLRRDADDKWLAGVCSGIATRLGVDPIVIRAALVLLVILGGVGITVYLIAWAFLPNNRDEIIAEKALRDGDVLGIILLVIIGLSLVGGTGLAGDSSGLDWVWWVVVPVGLVVWLVTRRRDGKPRPSPYGPAPYASAPSSSAPSSAAPYGPAPYASAPYGPAPYASAPYASAPSAPTVSEATTDPTSAAATLGPPTLEHAAASPTSYAPAPADLPPGGTYGPPPTPAAPRPPRPPKVPRRRSGGFVSVLLVGGLAIAAYGATLSLHRAGGWAGSDETVALAAALGVLGAGTLVLGLLGRRAGFTGFLAIVLALVTWTASVVPDVTFGGGIGERTWRPSTTDTSAKYRLGIGSAVLDLAAAQDNPGTARAIDARVGVGELRIYIPSNLTVEVRSSVGAGDISRLVTPDLGTGDTTGSDTTVPLGKGNGRNISTVETFGVGSPDVVVTAHVGLGQILIGKE